MDSVKIKIFSEVLKFIVKFQLYLCDQIQKKKSGISTVCKGSIRVSYGVCTVFVRFLYEFTTVYGSTTLGNKSKP